MTLLLDNYKKLIALGIDKSANLPDLNYMTDRSQDPSRPSLKPWTASKTCGTIALIKKYNIINFELLFNFIKPQFISWSKVCNVNQQSGLTYLENIKPFQQIFNNNLEALKLKLDLII